MKSQRRGQKISMSSDEIDAFLAEERTCRVATVGRTGPHATPLWFVWSADSLWLYSLSGSQRWADWEHDPRVAVVVDAGVEYDELRGVEIRGDAVVVGDVPRTEATFEELRTPELLFARKYGGTDTFRRDGRHAWRRITPEKITSWDFRKIPAR